MSLSQTGRRHSPETIEKMKKKQAGHRVSEETKRKISLANKGRKRTLEQRQRVSGPNASNWKGGVTHAHAKIRQSLEYRVWRKTVHERDNYTCQNCGFKGGHKLGNLNADHIKPFADYPKLRFDVSNGQTLCIPCHINTATYGNRSRRKGKFIGL